MSDRVSSAEIWRGHRTPLWLSHHYPLGYDRCIRIGQAHICRRCSVLYPLTFAVMLAALAGLRWPTAADPWLVWLLPVPVVAEWWAEQLGLAAYSPARNTILTAICAPAVGVGLARYMTEPTDKLFWAVVITYAVVCVAPVAIAARSGARSSRSVSPGRAPLTGSTRGVHRREEQLTQ